MLKQLNTESTFLPSAYSSYSAQFIMRPTLAHASDMPGREFILVNLFGRQIRLNILHSQGLCKTLNIAQVSQSCAHTKISSRTYGGVTSLVSGRRASSPTVRFTLPIFSCADPQPTTSHFSLADKGCSPYVPQLPVQRISPPRW